MALHYQVLRFDGKETFYDINTSFTEIAKFVFNYEFKWICYVEVKAVCDLTGIFEKVMTFQFCIKGNKVSFDETSKILVS